MIKQHTIQSFIYAECCNCRKTDSFCWPNERLCQILRGIRCGFFERCVMPISKHRSPIGEDSNRYRTGLQQKRQQAVGKYLDMVELGILTPLVSLTPPDAADIRAGTPEKGSENRPAGAPRLSDPISVVLYGYTEARA